jgi:1-acyl-sn-glycerol-3-phosphate acyltransferase
LLARTKVSGRRNIPRKGPFIIAVNHFSRIDPPLVIYAIRRPINFLMASDQTVESYLMWAPWLYGFIPIDRQSLAPSTVKRSLQVLKEGGILGIFPEGEATSKVLQSPKRGAVYLASISGAPILPVSIFGLDNVWEYWLKGVRPKIQIRIGKPFKTAPRSTYARQSKEQFFKEIGDEMMYKIAALLPVEYQGRYKISER